MQTNSSLPDTPDATAPAARHLRFIELRAQGLSFARIAAELQVSKTTLIDWSRKFQYEINNLRAVEWEALREKHLLSVEARLKSAGDQFRRIEEELSKRDLADVSTGRLIHLATRLRAELQREAGSMQFSVPSRRIPPDELSEEAQDWTP